MKTFTASEVIANINEWVQDVGLRGVARLFCVDAAQLHRTLNGKIPLSDAMATAFGFVPCAKEYVKRRTRSK